MAKNAPLFPICFSVSWNVLGGHPRNAVRERFMWHSRDCVTILNFVT